MFNIQDGRNHFYQWDLDRKLIVEDASINQVHFCNRTDDCSLVCEVYEEDGLRLVNVPNIMLQETWRITVYGYDVNYTKHSKVFDVKARTKPSDYVYTETEVLNYNTLLNRLNEIDESIEDTVTKWLQENPLEVDLSDYYNKAQTEEKIEEAVNALDEKIAIEFDNYASKSYVDELYENIDIPDVDLTGYATEDYVDKAVDNIKIPDTSSFVDALYVQTAINESLPDMSGYAKTEDIPSLDGYAKTSDIPDVSDFISEIPSEYITETELNAKGYLTEHQDLSGYATKAEIPDVSGFQTEEQVIALIAAHGGGGGNLPASEDGEF